jgi:hypothetical protein
LPSETQSLLLDAVEGGVLYALIGPIGSGNVWMLDADERSATQLTHNPEQYGISNFDASSAGLVMGDAASGIDLITVYENGRARDIAAGGLDGGDPAISPSGTLAYVGIPAGNSSDDSWQILTTDLSGASPRLLFEQRGPDLNVLDLGGLVWGPDEQLGMISAPGIRFGQGLPEVLVVEASGNVVLRVDPSIDEISYIAWNDSAPGIAISNQQGDSVLIALDGTETELFDDWTPQCWAPDGSALLVTQQTWQGLAIEGPVKVGIWRKDLPGAVDQIAEMPLDSPLWGCKWLDVPAANTP